MKYSQVYRKAARHIEENPRFGMCDAVEAVIVKAGIRDSIDIELMYEVIDLFHPDDDPDADRFCYWGERWGWNTKDCRILALLFMAAMHD